MKKTGEHILIFGGTFEGRRLSGHLCRSGFSCTECVATEYGEMAAEELPGLTLHRGRMDAAQMEEFIKEENYLAVVDATHPFATEVSANIRKSLQNIKIPYIRLRRDTGLRTRQESVFWFEDAKSCAEELSRTEGNILLTTGSRELKVFCREGIRERLYVRILPGSESIALCEKEGINGKQIIAMQGPFSMEMNEAMIRQLHIACLVTKESGSVGGFFPKMQAALNTHIPVYVLGNPEKEIQGLSFPETLQELYGLAGLPMPDTEMQISLIGMGMGNEKLLTAEAVEALKQTEVIFGAARLLEMVLSKKERYPYYQPEDILPRIRELYSEGRRSLSIAVLFSGDLGFYSGAGKLYQALKAEINSLDRNCEIRVYPGISSLSYLAGRLGISYHDTAIVSIHGRKADILRTVADNRKTFVLLSGAGDIRKLGELFLSQGLDYLTIFTGFQLSYPEEEINKITPSDCKEYEREGLYCCLIENERAGRECLTHGLRDDSFLRGGVPMTKEEIRVISVCKLHLTKKSILFDIGSGTGSIAVECARLSPHIAVYAIERKHEAAELIRNNCERFGVTNVEIVEAEAPDTFRELPAPTHAFIGGSGGNIRTILWNLYRMNPLLRVVMNAVTLESIGSMAELLKEFPLDQEEVIQVQVSRSKEAGSYHIMQAENPVHILSFEFKPDEKR